MRANRQCARLDGLPQLLLIPLMPALMKRFDVRLIGAIGIGIFAASSFMDITLSFDTAGDQFLIPDIVRAIGQALVLTPISTSPPPASRRATPARPPASPTCCATRRRGRHSDAADHHHQARAVPFQHHRPIGDALSDEVRQRLAEMTNYFLSRGVSDVAPPQP